MQTTQFSKFLEDDLTQMAKVYPETSVSGAKMAKVYPDLTQMAKVYPETTVSGAKMATMATMAKICPETPSKRSKNKKSTFPSKEEGNGTKVFKIVGVKSRNKCVLGNVRT